MMNSVENFLNRIGNDKELGVDEYIV